MSEAFYHDAVAKGVALLDQVWREWPTEMDFDTLNPRSDRACPLAQLGSRGHFPADNSYYTRGIDMLRDAGVTVITRISSTEELRSYGFFAHEEDGDNERMAYAWRIAGSNRRKGNVAPVPAPTHAVKRESAERGVLVSDLVQYAVDTLGAAVVAEYVRRGMQDDDFTVVAL